MHFKRLMELRIRFRISIRYAVSTQNTDYVAKIISEAAESGLFTETEIERMRNPATRGAVISTELDDPFFLTPD